MSVTPNQVQYLSPFCDDTPESIGKWIQVYNLFVRIGNDAETGYNSYRMSSIFNDIPFATGRIYDPADTEFNCSFVSPVLSVTGGSVVIKNTLIEVGDFDIDLYDTYSRWSPNGYNTWSFMPSVTTYCYLCVIFDPYNTDGTVKTSEPAATVAFVQEDDLDYDAMAPIWIAKVVKNSGGVITSATEFLLEYSPFTYQIEQLGYWKEFIVDGGDLG